MRGNRPAMMRTVARTRPVQGLVVLGLLATGLFAGGSPAAAETLTRTFIVTLPDSRALYLAVDDGEETTEVLAREGARNQTLQITVTATTETELVVEPSPVCHGTAVDQRIGVIAGGDGVTLVVERHYTPIGTDGVVGDPTTESLVEVSAAGPGAKRFVNVCA